MGKAFLASGFQVMIERINTSRELLEVIPGKKFKALLGRLKLTLVAASGVLMDAEHKEGHARDVNNWLSELRETFYRAEDILDEVHWEVLRQKVDAEDGGIRGLFRNLMVSPDSLYKKMLNNMEDITLKLEQLVKRIDVLGFREYSELDMPFRNSLPRTISSFPEPRLFGRVNDKLAIHNLLLTDDSRDLCVIPIVGMPGVGKTALVHAVYNESSVSDHFDLKAWISIGECFDVIKVTESVFQELTSFPSNLEDLHSLQFELTKILSGKKFLLVLDDVWSENRFEWESFRSALNDGKMGSKVLVTTRSEVVASIIQTIQSYDLKLLPDDDCWEFFSRLAFGNRQLASSSPQLEAIGKVIAKKCKGLPLMAKSIASSLFLKPNIEEWYAVSKNFPNYIADVLPVLKLSYDNLPSHLKQCFAYCSIFPKSYEFEAEKLVLLWMAEDLLQQPKSSKRMEETGHEYFNELVSRSFFIRSNGNKSCFVMHDLMNDLAKSVSGEICARLEDNADCEILEKVLHLSISGSQRGASGVFSSIHRAKYLRTILPVEAPAALESLQLTDKILQDMFRSHRYLRVLCLSNYDIKKLPDSVGSLKHLRYLGLSCTAIKRLPDSLCTLYNLQTLLLSNCRSLTSLPTNMGRLISLRYLDLVGTPLKELPVGMSRLRNLSMLTNFVIGRMGGAGLRELKELTYLRGTLDISELQNVSFATEAKEASLKTKKYIDSLVLRWTARGSTFFPGRTHTISCDQKEVLERLEPHPNLKSLIIEFYGGGSFPGWLGDSSFSNLVSLCLRSCNLCLSLPPLGELPSLKDLIVEDFDRVQKVGSEFFYGRNDPSVKPFQSLQTLKFNGMPRWEEWFSPEVDGGVFPNLEKLYIQNCPKLTKCFLRGLPSFPQVIISHCPLTVEDLKKHGFESVGNSIPSSSRISQSTGDQTQSVSDVEENNFEDPTGKQISLESMTISQITEIMELPPGLCRLSIEGCEGLDKLPKGVMDCNPYLQDLFVISCSSLENFPGGHLPFSLKTLYIRDCRNLEFTGIVRSEQPCPRLEHLSIGSSCDSLRTFPLALFPKLKSLSIWDCANFSSITLADNFAEDLISIEALEIRDCPNFDSLPEGGLPTPKLSSVLVSNCKNLKALPERLSLLFALQSLFIYECPELEKVPTGGFPPNLSTLCITRCDKLIPEMAWGLHKLEKLHNFEIEGECKEVGSFPHEYLLPQNLRSLRISEFRDLKDLNFEGLQKLRSLISLEIASCHNLLSLPDDGFPSSLCYLYINDCPSMKAKLLERGRVWYKISRIPHAVIDGEDIHEIPISESTTHHGKGKLLQKI